MLEAIEEKPDLQRVAARELRQRGYAMIDGELLRSSLEVDDTQLSTFGRYWDSLGRDEYMADNGTYRFRRYSHFVLDSPDDPLRIQPHEPYSQPIYINTLNGGRDRYYLPLEPGFMRHPCFQSLMYYFAGIYNRAEGRPCRWTIRLHPYRIVASQIQRGKPTPEGLHRDGVDYITILMIRRAHIRGGTTTITDNHRRPLYRSTLAEPFDLLMAHDSRVMHDVSPIETTFNGQGYRDVLVVAFEKA